MLALSLRGMAGFPLKNMSRVRQDRPNCQFVALIAADVRGAFLDGSRRFVFVACGPRVPHSLASRRCRLCAG